MLETRVLIHRTWRSAFVN